MVTKDFRERSPAAIARMTEMFLKTSAEGYAGCIEAIRDMDHRALLAKISAPTLVIAGPQDPATPLEGNKFIRAHIPGPRIAVLEAAHIANVERPALRRHGAGVSAEQGVIAVPRAWSKRRRLLRRACIKPPAGRSCFSVFGAACRLPCKPAYALASSAPKRKI